jgi:RHS repeat-associated protein
VTESGSSAWITDSSGNACTEQSRSVNQYLAYMPFEESFINQKRRDNDIRFKFTGKERDAESGFDYFGARYYSSDLSIWLSVNHLSNRAPNISPFVYVLNNPVRYTNPDGNWPIVHFWFIQGSIGAGLGGALYVTQQSGIAYDKAGTTHFIVTGVAHITNQDFSDGSLNTNFTLGVEAGISGGYKVDWGSETFIESVNKYSLSGPGPKIKGSVGIGLTGGFNSFSITLGLQAGVTINTVKMKVTESISLTDQQAKKISNLTDVKVESWVVRDISKEVVDGKTTGYKGFVYTKDSKGKWINSKIVVNSGVRSESGKPTSNHIWLSKEYKENTVKD